MSGASGLRKHGHSAVGDGGALTSAVTTSGLTQATGKLLGRSTASTGAIEEITVGTNLTLAAGTLSASGGGGGGGWSTESTDGVKLDSGRDLIYDSSGAAGVYIRLANPDIFVVPDTAGSLYLDVPEHLVAEFALDFQLPQGTSDPTPYDDGSTFYNISTHVLRIRANGAWKNVPIRKGSGTATVASGSTSIAVTHSAGYTPATSDIKVTPTNNPTNDPGWFWISTVGGTTFTINVRADPGASGATFAWSVDH